MSDEAKYVLGDDLPKHNPWEEYRLGYAPVAKKVADLIVHLAAPNGYVIGLHGEWGSGKSTFVNFVVEYLKKYNAEHEDRQIVHIDFRPWIVSGHQDLVAAFFKLLSTKLGSKDGFWKRHWKRLLESSDGTADRLVDAAATVAITVDPSGGLISGLTSKIAKRSVNSAIDRFLKDSSLQEAYEDLKRQLVRRGKRFLVTIDDIDRLAAKDIRSTMQMVKSIGCLPNVVYLLAYDREIVWTALDQGIDRVGPRFAEKIVQQEMELPRPNRHALLSILDQELAFLFALSDNSLR